MTPPPIVDAADDAEALAWRVAGFIAARAPSASECFGLCLSGGSTPKRVNELLGAKDFGALLDWQNVRRFRGTKGLCRRIIETVISAWPASP
jgi:6-phosphogluconolactonase